MIRSMTGFGRGTVKTPYGEITAEIKTLNHKSLSINCAPFNGLFLVEEKLKDIVNKKISRGKVFIRITREASGGSRSLQTVEINEKTAKDFLDRINKLKKNLKVPGEVEIKDLLALPGVVETSSSKKDNKLWVPLKQALTAATGSLVKYREKEGKVLAQDFKKRLGAISKSVTQIAKYEKRSVSDFKKELKKKMKEMTGEPADRTKIEDEVALFARNCDIAEEITRIKGHIKAYLSAMAGTKKEVGKKLDFIAQEMQREANTMGAKSSSFELSQSVIEVKSQIEKLREQIKNVE